LIRLNFKFASLPGSHISSLLDAMLTISYPHKLTGFARDFSPDLILVAKTDWISRVAKGGRKNRSTHETLRVAGHARPVSRSRFARHCANLVRPRFPAITQHAFTHYARITCDARESTGRCVCRVEWTRRGNRRYVIRMLALRWRKCSASACESVMR